MAGTVYLIDTFSLMFQVFHGIPPMTSPAGLPTNAVFGFSRDLVTLLKDHKPTWLICAMESPGPGIRDGIYAEYKANRTEMPEDLRPQIEMLKEVIHTFNVPLIEHAGWEADDVIATLTRQAVARGDNVRIVTSDKDARQLLGPLVKIYNLRKNTYLDEAGLLLDWGVRPDQVVDFQSLVGDAVDNVPGVPLIGPKKAATLLQTYGTLEDVLANSDQVKGEKLKQNLKTYADQAYLSRQLVRLNQDLPIDFDWETRQLPQPDVPALQDLFRKYGFRRLIDDVQQFAPAEAASKPAPAPQRKAKTSSKGQRSLFDDEDTTEEPPLEPGETASDRHALEQSNAPDSPATPLVNAAERSWRTIDSADEFLQFLELLKKHTRFCVDLETTHVDATRAEIVGWAFSWEPGTGYYLPVRGPAGSAAA